MEGLRLTDISDPSLASRSAPDCPTKPGWMIAISGSRVLVNRNRSCSRLSLLPPLPAGGYRTRWKNPGLSERSFWTLALRIAFLEGVVSLRVFPAGPTSAFRSCIACCGICNTSNSVRGDSHD